MSFLSLVFTAKFNDTLRRPKAAIVVAATAATAVIEHEQTDQPFFMHFLA